MKRITSAFLILISVAACKDKPQNTPTGKELSISENIAFAHGFELWDKVEQIDFRFNIDRDTAHYFRSWAWKPRTGDVTYMTATDTLRYNRNSVDSLSVAIDQRFVNDKYWLMVPFQLMWDDGLSVSDPVKEVSPIMEKELNKITLTYSGDGGYTPGDAYDLYFNDSFMIEEWIFRKGNSKEPSLTNTFENYKDFNGIKLATEHKRPGSSWNLNFTDIHIKMDD